MHTFEPAALLFVQIALILAFCRFTAFVFKYLGQSPVVGEMIAGVLLGPSVFGWLAPTWSATLFPAENRPLLFALAQLGLVLYMFGVGLEFDLGLLRTRSKGALLISLSGIALPFALGAGLAQVLLPSGELFADGTSPLIAALFMGVAMSITAFPMLARIINEQGLSRTSFGTMVLAAGSIDDAAAWCVLAAVLSLTTGNASIAWMAIGGSALYLLVLATVGRRLIAFISARVEAVGSSRVDLQACKLEYSIVSPK